MFAQPLPYWRTESSGKLTLAVARYFAYAIGEDPTPLTDSELVLLKWYVKEWINYPWQGLGSELDYLRSEFEQAETYKNLRDCIDTALELGIDPF